MKIEFTAEERVFLIDLLIQNNNFSVNTIAFYNIMRESNKSPNIFHDLNTAEKEAIRQIELTKQLLIKFAESK